MTPSSPSPGPPRSPRRRRPSATALALLTCGLVILALMIGLLVDALGEGSTESSGHSRAAENTGMTATAPGRAGASGNVPSSGGTTRQDAEATRPSEECPAPVDNPGVLAKTTVTCLSDEGATSLAALADGHPLVINLWAYWCEPCRRELPVLATAARDLAAAGDPARVILVHVDPAAQAGRNLLAELGVESGPGGAAGAGTLAAAEDAHGTVAAALGAPAVLPVTIFVRADGAVAHREIAPVSSAEDVHRLVHRHLSEEAP